MNLYILSYNNYYNRIVRKENNITDYLYYVTYGPLVGANFNPNDGVNTEATFGGAGTTYDGKGDYLLVVNDNNEIESRWFIIDHERLCNGQWKTALRRDLFVDFYDEVIDADMFIEKANLSYDDPLIFNEENITVNQIKTAEYQLKDNSGCAWIVGYYSKNQELSGTVPINSKADIPSIALPGSIETWDFYNATNLASTQVPIKGVVENGKYVFGVKTLSALGSTYYDYDIGVNIFDGNAARIYGTNVPSTYNAAEISYSSISDAFKNYGLNKLNYNNYTGNLTQEKITELMEYAGNTIYDSVSGKYYTCNVNNKSVTNTFDIPQGSELFNSLDQILSSVYNFSKITGFPNNDSFKIQCSYIEYTIVLEELTQKEQRYNITSEKLKTEDAPWDIFAIPYGTITVKNLDGTTILTTNANNGLITAMAMQADQGSKIHDIQLLPYCPIQSLISGSNEITVTNQLQYTLIQAEEGELTEPSGIIFHIPKSTFYFDITSLNFPAGVSAIEKKIKNTCEKWRLTSPNFSNYFDFSVEKNNGIVYFNVDCNYKPFTPYIHINPNFGGLYGYDDNSPRGLVLGGDFSLSQIIDQWQQYQIQNKNFQNIFDRQIQNMEVQQTYGRVQDIVGGITGAAQGFGAGMLTGSMFGKGITGGIIGSAASFGGGIADFIVNEKLRNETMDYTKDMFGYQLGNIQALPNTISKVSAFNNNNKIFPILEYYTCTDREKQAVLNKIAWNGMTVMTIGKISDYMNNSWSYNNTTSKNYIKGQLIRLDSIDDDFHIINSISGELNKGAYFE